MSANRLQPHQQDPSLKAGNVQQSAEKVNVGGYVNKLLASPDITGQEVVDRFLGALVANGEVKGSVATYTPELIATLIADAAQKYEDLPTDGSAGTKEQEAAWNRAFTSVTNRNGCRNAFVALLKDERTTELLHLGGSEGSLHERMGGDGSQGFASLDMLDSYLNVLSANRLLDSSSAESSPADAEVGHEQRVVEAVGKYAGLDVDRSFQESIDQNVRSAVDTIRREALELSRSVAWLEQRGAAISTIEATAQRLRAMHKRNLRLGDVALGGGIGGDINPLEFGQRFR